MRRHAFRLRARTTAAGHQRHPRDAERRRNHGSRAADRRTSEETRFPPPSEDDGSGSSARSGDTLSASERGRRQRIVSAICATRSVAEIIARGLAGTLGAAVSC